MLIELLVLIFIIGPVIGLIVFGISGAAVIGGAERNKNKNLANKHQILSQVFDGRPVATIVTGGGNLPFETVMEEAPRYGYRFVSHDNGELVMACVFERVYNPTGGQAGY